MLRFTYMNIPPKHDRELCELLASIKNENEADMLMQDLLTPQEIESLAERWQLVQELAKGTPQRDIAKKLSLSISKITRGSRVMQYGSGGFPTFLQRLKKTK